MTLCLAFGSSSSASPSALLSSQLPLSPAQVEEKLLSSPGIQQQDVETEKQLIREVRPEQMGGGELGWQVGGAGQVHRDQRWWQRQPLHPFGS